MGPYIKGGSNHECETKRTKLELFFFLSISKFFSIHPISVKFYQSLSPKNTCLKVFPLMEYLGRLIATQKLYT